MCGIAGFTTEFGKDSQELKSHLTRMLATIQQRGPDSHGTWVNRGIALGHNRLSILDLSQAGHQPMISSRGRYVLSYNGEVYNARNLAREFPQNYVWRGHSDTEVILAVIERDGIEAAIKKFVGMFAFALFDLHMQELHLVRDPVGIKPLYYGMMGKTFLFGSQIKALAAHPQFQAEICSRAMAEYFKYNYIPAPYSIYKNCYKLEPGHLLTVREGKVIKKTAYWSMEDAALRGLKNPVADHLETIEAVEALLKDSVNHQLEADVPVGVFLSGGIDSSLIASLVQSQRSQPIKTFTIGFHEPQYNEAHYALAVAQHLKTDHVEEYLSMSKVLDLISEIPVFCDEPFADSSQLPTLLVSQLARRDVTVVLSGDGGDEFFAGYSRYFDVLKFRKFSKITPHFLQSGLAYIIQRLQGQIGRFMGPDLAFKLHMASRCLRHQSVDEIYDTLFDFWPNLFERESREICSPTLRSRLSDLGYMQYHDSTHYLPDDILTKVDRCSMHVSLESRVPFLDHRLIELSWRLTDFLKYNHGQSKWILRKILNKYVPEHLIDRPKKGFGVPIDVWLRGPLKDWAMALLSDIKSDQMIPYAPIEKCWQQHQNKQINWQHSLWGVLMWQHWKNTSMGLKSKG